MSDGPLPPISTADLVENPLGLALAAFGSPEAVKLLLGCDDRTAEAVRLQALDRWCGLMADVAATKRRAGLPS